MVETFERFTDRSRRVLVLAQEEARLSHDSFIGTEHILLGLIHEGEGVAAKALESLGVDLEATRVKMKALRGETPSGGRSVGSPPFTPRAKKMLELSLREALQLGHNYIGTEHVLLGLVREGEGIGARVLIAEGVDLSRVRGKVIELLSGYAPASQAAPELPDAKAILDGVIGQVRKRASWLQTQGMHDAWLDTALGIYDQAYPRGQ